MFPRTSVALAVLSITLAAGCRRTPEPSAPVPAPPIPRLDAIERVLGGADPEQPLPTIIAIHGLGDRPEGFEALFTGFSPPARLVLPRGPMPYGQGVGWFASRAGDRDPEALSKGMRAGAAAVLALIDRLEAEGKVLGKPIVTGFSQGGMVTYALAIEHADRIGYALPVGGILPPPLWPKHAAEHRGIPIRALHGRSDQIVPYGPAAQGIRALAARGLDAEMVTFEGVGHSVPPEVRDTLHRMLMEALERTARANPPAAKVGTRTATAAP